MKLTLFSLLLLISLIGCSQKKETKQPTPPDMHTSQLAIDVAGTYTGVLPCASCEGIETTVTLTDSTYNLTMVYLGEDDPNTFKESGTYSWNEDGSTITLNDEKEPSQYFVGENVLIRLNENGERVTGELAEFYRLEKKL